MLTPGHIRAYILSGFFSLVAAGGVMAQAAGDESPPSPAAAPVPDNWAITLLKISGVPAEIGLPSDLQAEAASVVKQVDSISLTLFYIANFPDQEKQLAPQGKGQLEAQVSKLIQDFSAKLSPAQQRRLSELYLQKAGPGALLDPGVQTALGLTAPQTAQIGELKRNLDQATGENNKRRIMDLLNETNGKMSQADATQDVAAATAQDKQRAADFNAALTGVLSADQQARFETLKGVQFSFPPDQT